MKPLNLKVLLTLIAALVPVANATFGWHLVPAVVAAMIAAFIGLVVAIAHVEASHGTLAQDWAAIEPKLRLLIQTLDHASTSAQASTKALQNQQTVNQQVAQQVAQAAQTATQTNTPTVTTAPAATPPTPPAQG